MRPWLFSTRRRKAREAWKSYVESGAAGPSAKAEEMPALFEAGFHMGVGARQREEETQ